MMTARLSFKAHSGGFQLTHSSQYSSLTEDAKTRSGELLGKIIQHLPPNQKPLWAQTNKIEAVVKRVQQDNKTTYLFELQGSKKLVIQLNGEVARAISGQPPTVKQTSVPSTPPQPVKKPATKPPSVWKVIGKFFQQLFAPKPRRPATDQPIAGFYPMRNTGSDCFVNTVFQVIVHDPELRQAVIETYGERHPLVSKIRAYERGERNVSVHSLRKCFGMSSLRQEDASELFQRILSNVHRDRHPGLFAKTTTHYTLSNNEEKLHTIRNSSHDLLIPVTCPEEPMDGQTLIDGFQHDHPHEGEDYEMEGELYRPLLSSTTLSADASRITLQLRRFTGDGRKNQTHVAMPEILQVNGQHYQLTSCIIHEGTTSGGHYYSLIEHEGRWIKCDDSRITTVHHADHYLAQGYMYFYKKI